MPQEESPLIGLAHKVFDTLNSWGATKDIQSGKDTNDYSWHASKVAEANKSHVDAEKKGTSMKSTSATGGKPKSKKTRKRAPAKR